jgi:ribonuclease HII
VVLCGFYLHNEKVRGEILAHFPKRMLKDSKKLTEKWRDSLASLFHTQKESGDVSFILAERSAHDIDNRGISICIKECVAEILKTACADSKVTAQEIRR